MKTILVTGGAGYIGSHAVKELINQNYNVVVLDNLENGHREAISKQASLEIVDLKDKEKIAEVFAKHSIDAVIDFAAYLAVGESMDKPEKYLRNNVLNFINLLDVMAETGCGFIIKSSTAATYGNPTKENDIPWKEDFTDRYQPQRSALLEGKWQSKTTFAEDFFQLFINEYYNNIAGRPELRLNDNEITKLRIPMSIYGLSKLLDEIILNKYDKLHSIKSVSLRYFNVCGAHPDGDLGDDKPAPTNLMTVAMLQALGKIPEIKIFGQDYNTPDGTGVRDYIHPSDLATGHIKALEYLFRGGQSEVINLGTGRGASVLEVIGAAEKASSRKINAVKAPRRSGDPDISIADPSKAKQLLDWQTEFDLEQMARTAWNWHSNHPDGFKS
ncbi:MAG: UDP-glucose 4-epimerase [bacterium ADurb.Bin212]|nr:MAG: UDP-glucose 4-epimerase [bacterium ADurb.Bin212]